MHLGLTDVPESLSVNLTSLCEVFLDWRGSFMLVTLQRWKNEKNGKFHKHFDIAAPSQVKPKIQPNWSVQTGEKWVFSGRRIMCDAPAEFSYFLWTLSAVMFSGVVHCFPLHLIPSAVLGVVHEVLGSAAAPCADTPAVPLTHSKWQPQWFNDSLSRNVLMPQVTNALRGLTSTSIRHAG